jgi:hypothetical protein
MMVIRASPNPKAPNPKAHGRCSMCIIETALRGEAATKIGELTPHPAAHGRHPLPTGEGGEYLSFSPGKKVAEGRGRMRGRVIHLL